MIAIDLLSGLLGAALAFLLLSVGLIVASQPAPTSRTSSTRPLPARAAPRAVASTRPSTDTGARGQIALPADSRRPSERSSLDAATDLARHYADNDPQRIVEVIGFWMREEVADRLEQASRMQSEYLDAQDASSRAKHDSSQRRS